MRAAVAASTSAVQSIASTALTLVRLARRRPDVTVTTVRAANVIGPHVVSPITSYFRLPVLPRVVGFDPRLQFLHEDDLLGVLKHAVVAGVPGTFNVAGDGMLMLSQATRRLNKPTVAMPAFAVGRLGTVLRQARVADFSPEQIGFLTFGRGVDTTRMRTVLGFEPRFTTASAFADFGVSLGVPLRGDTLQPAPEGGTHVQDGA